MIVVDISGTREDVQAELDRRLTDSTHPQHAVLLPSLDRFLHDTLEELPAGCHAGLTVRINAHEHGSSEISVSVSQHPAPLVEPEGQ